MPLSLTLWEIFRYCARRPRPHACTFSSLPPCISATSPPPPVSLRICAHITRKFFANSFKPTSKSPRTGFAFCWPDSQPLSRPAQVQRPFSLCFKGGTGEATYFVPQPRERIPGRGDRPSKTLSGGHLLEESALGTGSGRNRYPDGSRILELPSWGGRKFGLDGGKGWGNIKDVMLCQRLDPTSNG